MDLLFRQFSQSLSTPLGLLPFESARLFAACGSNALLYPEEALTPS
jgi:hypothetical protein